MRNFLKLAALLVALSPLQAGATLFQYSYTFANGWVVSGTLSGVQNGQNISNVTNVTGYINGAAIGSAGGALVPAGLNQLGFISPASAPQISANVDLNNFMFADNYLNPTGFFYMYHGWDDNWNVGIYNAAGNDGGYFLAYSPVGRGVWSLTEVTSVPEPGMLLLAGLGLMGVGMVRRRRAKLPR